MPEQKDIAIVFGNLSPQARETVQEALAIAGALEREADRSPAGADAELRSRAGDFRSRAASAVASDSQMAGFACGEQAEVSVHRGKGPHGTDVLMVEAKAMNTGKSNAQMMTANGIGTEFQDLIGKTGVSFAKDHVGLDAQKPIKVEPKGGLGKALFNLTGGRVGAIEVKKSVDYPGNLENASRQIQAQILEPRDREANRLARQAGTGSYEVDPNFVAAEAERAENVAEYQYQKILARHEVVVQESSFLGKQTYKNVYHEPPVFRGARSEMEIFQADATRALSQPNGGATLTIRGKQVPWENK